MSETGAPHSPEAPLWRPTRAQIERTRMHAFMGEVAARHGLRLEDYGALYRWSLASPEAFWGAVWRFCGVIASRRGPRVLERPRAMPGARWFPDSRLNFAQNLLRRRDSGTALVGIREDGRRSCRSYQQLYREVARLARGMRALGVGPGDRVAGYLPNCPEAVVGMLASASIGAIWSSCSPDFGPQGLLDRFGQIEPRLLLCADGYRYRGRVQDSLAGLARVVRELPGLRGVRVVPFLGRDTPAGGLPEARPYADLLGADDDPGLEFLQLPFDHPLYILYSSGTTGPPKCILHGAGGTLLQHLKELMLHCDLRAGESIFYYTSCGWMMWNWLVSGLALGARLILYDGSPFHPRPSRLIDLAQAEGIVHFGVSAKYLAALEQAGVRPRQSHRLGQLRSILSTGSPLAPASFDYVYREFRPALRLSSISGGTDIVSCFALGCPLAPVYRGELQCRGLGMAVEVYGDHGRPLGPGERGELVCTRPFPSMPLGFWGDPAGRRYRQAYFSRFPGVWLQGDFAELTAHGGLIIHGRSDAVLNPGGVRIGTAEIYRLVEQLPEVEESLAVGQQWHGDERVILFVKLGAGHALDPALMQRIREQIRQGATPRHVPARILAVDDIPRTRNNKIAELAVRELIHGRPVRQLAALANPEALAQFQGRAELAGEAPGHG